ncbi:MAG: hypothetical protein HY540_06735 [Deltaproteobacteria bacterium]|nr:hypothetical protein [Deltaproteobacteria bacterium]
MSIAIHVTHEAIQKIGGIGSVIENLLTSPVYQKKFPRNLLYTPLFHADGDPEHKLGPNSQLITSNTDHIDHQGLRKKFEAIEHRYGISIVYGKKRYVSHEEKHRDIDTDILAVGIQHMKPEAIDAFKFQLWEHFGIDSELYRHDADYEQYLRIAIPLTDIMEAIYGEHTPAVLFSHEYMGMPSALALTIEKRQERRKGDRTYFYAHEISTARSIVEHHPGHDFMFYNVMQHDQREGISLEQQFGSYRHYSRNELVKRALYLDGFIAVSDIIKEEYQYLCPQAEASSIHVIPNGVPVVHCKVRDKDEACALVGQYCENLFNFSPDYIFSHVTRLVLSKGLWRDISLLYLLDEQLAAQKKKAFFVLLSTSVGSGRPKNDALKMEADYGWPLLHREGWPDLVGQEVDLYRQLELFNARSKVIKGVFLNQFGFNQSDCGMRMPSEMNLFHLRLASDLEFGLSIYEPFGIAQIETLPYGGYPLITDICGCASLLKKSYTENDAIIVDSTRIPHSMKSTFQSVEDFKHMTTRHRDQIEYEHHRSIAPRIIELLPQNDRARRKHFERMQDKASALKWDHAAVGLTKLL